MDARAAWARENLSGFIQDLPPGSHAMLLLDAMGVEAVLEACRADAEEAGEDFCVGPAREGWPACGERVLDPSTVREALRARSSRGPPHRDRRGALVVIVGGDHAGRSGTDVHIALERALRRNVPAEARVVCVYEKGVMPSLDTWAWALLGGAHSEVAAPERAMATEAKP